MMFGRALADKISILMRAAALAASASGVVLAFGAAPGSAESLGYAVVPTQIIYPGEEIVQTACNWSRLPTRTSPPAMHATFLR